MTSLKLRALSACCLLAAITPAAVPSCITTQRLMTGLSNPVFVASGEGDVNHIYLVEQGGKIKIMDLTTSAVTVFLDITPLVLSGGEQGLLGLAFSSEYDLDRKFYVNYTQQPDGATRVVEYTCSSNPLVADASSARSIITIAQPQASHNGGWMGFSVDNDLYIALGDGGAANDDGTGHTIGTGNAQDITQNLLGKMLRINPFADDFPCDDTRNYGIPISNPFYGSIPGDDEIWAYGLRNPWRCSFDRYTFDLWIGDVGQDTREEIDFQPQTSHGGENYGWRLREGSIANPAPGIGGPPPPGNVSPLYDYAHGTSQFQGNCVIGGYCYRGPIAQLQGVYFFGDNVAQKVWSLTRNGSGYTALTDWTTQFHPNAGTITQISSFGEDQAGNLYIVCLDGDIFKVVQVSPFATAVSSVTQAVTNTVQRAMRSK